MRVDWTNIPAKPVAALWLTGAGIAAWLAGQPLNNKHFLQVRDAYFDLALDKKKSYRIRFGQSKVPFGFENLLLVA